MNVSEHFGLWEFGQPARHGQPAEAYPADWTNDPTRLPKLLIALERIRAEFGKPVRILSGYRSEAYNEAVYAEAGEPPTKSQHSQGRAADIVVIGESATEVHDRILALYVAGEIDIGGLGFYPHKDFVHVDVRVGWDHLAQWTNYGA